MIVAIAFGLYLVNFAVGLCAKLGGMQFGKIHHALYALVFLAAIVAAIEQFHIGLGLTCVALALLPLARGRSAWHPALATAGLLGYLAAIFGA